MAYELDLPKEMKVFPVFHPWLLHLDDSDPLPGQRNSESPPLATYEDGSGDYVVTEVVDSKLDRRRKDPRSGKKGCLMYKIRYEGYESWNANSEW